MKDSVKVLCIDGGGIRGIIPAVFLENLERKIQKPIHKAFDMIAGTSTGGILAIGLSIPGDQNTAKYTAADMIKLYEKQGPNIFSSNLWQKIIGIGNLRTAKFPSFGIDQVLDTYFGEKMLSDTLTNLLITSYEIERRQSWFFKSYKAKNDQRWNFKLSDVARSTSAAPTYFPPKKINTNNSQEYLAFVDGGVFANNPSMCAYVEAKKMWPDRPITLISIGTGNQTKSISYQKAKNWGIAQWGRPILDVVFDGVEDTVHYHLNKITKGTSDKYYRFQIVLNEGSGKIDDVSKENLRILKLLGEKMVDFYQNDILQIIKDIQ